MVISHFHVFMSQVDTQVDLRNSTMMVQDSYLEFAKKNKGF